MPRLWTASSSSSIKSIMWECQDVAGIRWAFDVGSWKPSQQQWLKASTLVQPEELDRIRRFAFARDSKAAIVGRLLMRKMAVEVLGLRQLDSSVQLELFARTDHGKPYLNVDLSPGTPALSFNVSHQGSYCVLAAEMDRPVGVDVTRMVYEGGKAVPEFFRLMRRQFSPQEWATINRPSVEAERLRLFYRHWALKESYVKALGVGIAFDLQRLGFQLKTFLSSSSSSASSSDCDRDLTAVLTDTTLLVDRAPATNWTFEEQLLDNEHWVAVALGTATSVVLEDATNSSAIRPPLRFEFVNFDDLVRNLEPLRPIDASLWTEFAAKPNGPS